MRAVRPHRSPLAPSLKEGRPSSPTSPPVPKCPCLELVESGRFEIRQGVGLAELDEPVEGELFLPLLSEAVVIATMNPLPADQTQFQVKVRLNLGAPAGLSLHRLRIHEFDGAFGGRWNAGSNRCDGGTDLSPDQYLDELATRLARAMEELKDP